MLEMVDYYGGTVTILALASVEVIAINWIYGTSVLTRDFNFMLQVVKSIYNESTLKVSTKCCGT